MHGRFTPWAAGEPGDGQARQYGPPEHYGRPEHYRPPGQYGPPRQYSPSDQYGPPGEYAPPRQYGPPAQEHYHVNGEYDPAPEPFPSYDPFPGQHFPGHHASGHTADLPATGTGAPSTRATNGYGARVPGTGSRPAAMRAATTAVGPGGSPQPALGGRRLPGPIVLTAIVAALLLAFGIGAALLSPRFTGGQTAAAQSGEQPAEPPANAPADVPGIGEAPEASPVPTTAEPAPTPAATTPTPERTTTKPKPKPKPKPKSSTTKATSRTTALENQVTSLVNAERADAGCGVVRTNEKLRKAARGHSQDMADRNYFSHDSPDGRSPWDRAKAAGYARPIGENIAKGQTTPESVMTAWMNSDGHRKNILNCDARAIGVGLAYDGGTPIWTQLFGAT